MYLLVYLNNVTVITAPEQKNARIPHCQDGSAVVLAKDICGRLNNSIDFIIRGRTHTLTHCRLYFIFHSLLSEQAAFYLVDVYIKLV